MNQSMKMIWTPTQKEIKMVDKIRIGTFERTLTSQYLPLLVGTGYIVFSEDIPKLRIETNLTYYIQRLARRKGWTEAKMEGYLTSLMEINKSCVFSILLMEIALTLDEQYSDHINNSEEIYCISLGNGKITKLNKALVKNYKNFAAFRSIEDAKIACSILKDWLKEMFK